MFNDFNDYDRSLIFDLYVKVLFCDVVLNKEKLNNLKKLLNVKYNHKINDLKVNDIIVYFKDKSFSKRKIIYFNLLYLLLSKDTITVNQYEYLNNIKESFMINNYLNKDIYKIAFEKIDLDLKIDKLLK